MADWADLVERIQQPTDEVTIHVVGKYVGLEDSYKSLHEALVHGGFKHRVKVNVKWVEAEALEQEGGDTLLDGAHGILVPGGFGDRGTRGMMRAAAHRTRRAGSRSSASATASSGRRSSSPATSVAWPTPIPPSAHRRPRPRSSTSCAICSASTISAARCGSDPYACQLEARFAVAAAVRRRRHPRASSPSLRVQLPLRAGPRRQGAPNSRALTRRQVRRDGGAARSPVVHRRTVPP